VYLWDDLSKALSFFYITHLPISCSTKQHMKSHNTGSILLWPMMTNQTVTCLPSAPKPNLEKHAKTKFWGCYIRSSHKNSILTVMGWPSPQYTVLVCLFLWFYLIMAGMCCRSGLGSSIGIATGYGLDGPGIKSRWGRDFSHMSIPALGPTQPPVRWVLGISRG
jgi:hypothetical protein